MIWITLDHGLQAWRTNLFQQLARRTTSIIWFGAAAARDDVAFAAPGVGRPQLTFVEGSTNRVQTLRERLPAQLVSSSEFEACAYTAGFGYFRVAHHLNNESRQTWASPGLFSRQKLSNFGSAVPVKSVRSLCAKRRADFLIFDDKGLACSGMLSGLSSRGAKPAGMLFTTAEKSWDRPRWRLLCETLKTSGYTVLDPSGYELTDESDWYASLSWYALAVLNDGNLASAVADDDWTWGATKTFRNTVVGELQPTVLRPAPFVADMEMVSLRTAALASGATYSRLQVSDNFFDVNRRNFVQSATFSELAEFKRAEVFASAGWKLSIDGHLFVEELGYSMAGRIPGLASEENFGGRRVLSGNIATLAHESTAAPKFLLGGDAAYYHWLLNWLPRLRTIQDFPDRFDHKNLEIIVSNRMPDAYLSLVDRLVDIPHSFLRLPEQGIWSFDNILVPNFFSHHQFHRSITDWFHDRLNVPMRKGSKRIYLSRSDAGSISTPRRKVVNEEQVISALAKFDFEPAFLQGKSLEYQIELFADCDFVVGPHGAGFANMQFAPSGSRALVFENEWNHDFMIDMLRISGHIAEKLSCSDVVRLEYEQSFIRDGVLDPEIRRSRDMLVNISRLESQIRDMLD